VTIDIPALIVAAGGEVVGKIRLQKIVYLLDQIGLNSGFSYEYHHYGPYSGELAEQVRDDEIFGKLRTRSGYRQSDGVPYTIYTAEAPGDGEAIDRTVNKSKIRAALGEMQQCSATILELAATMNWLSNVENRADWREELIRRKGAKVGNGRDRRALELLRSLSLPPAA
jgi:uncharacterized protein